MSVNSISLRNSSRITERYAIRHHTDSLTHLLRKGDRNLDPITATLSANPSSHLLLPTGPKTLSGKHNDHLGRIHRTRVNLPDLFVLGCAPVRSLHQEHIHPDLPAYQSHRICRF